MISKAKLTGMILAIGAASVFALAPAVSLALGNKVTCYGVNGCKGKSSCKTANNACKGKNSCKGQGMKMMSAKACAKAGGKTTQAAQ